MEMMLWILQKSNLIFVVLALGALSGLISERAGVVNIAIEGMMIIGGLTFVLFAKYVGNYWGNWSQIIALLVVGIVGMLFASLHAFIAINLKSNQIISGIGLNILALAIANFVVKSGSNNGFIAINDIYHLPKLFNSNFFNLYFIFTVLVIVLLIIAFKYSKWGLHHIAVGENPIAAAACGINVIKIRYAAVLSSGFLAAIAGSAYVMNASQTFRGSVDGNGFLALAILIFGQWRVHLLTIGAILFAILQTTGVSIIYEENIPKWVVTNKELFNLIPYLVSLLILLFTSKWSKMPKALGKPFYNQH